MLQNMPVKTLTHKQLTIEGYSRAAVQSYWRIPELKLGFDLGAQPWSFMGTQHWFVSHGHLDHILGIGGLASTLGQWDVPVDSKLEIYGGRWALDRVRDLMKVVMRGKEVEIEIEYIEIKPGVLVREKNLTVSAFPVLHRGTGNFGFVFEEKSKRPFLVERATELGVPIGPERKKLVAGESITFPADHLFRGTQRTVSVRRGGMNEIVVKHAINRAGGLPDNYNDEMVTNDMDVSSSAKFNLYTGDLDPRLDWTVGRRGVPFLDWGPHPGTTWVRDQDAGDGDGAVLGPHDRAGHRDRRRVVDRGDRHRERPHRCERTV